MSQKERIIKNKKNKKKRENHRKNKEENNDKLDYETQIHKEEFTFD